MAKPIKPGIDRKPVINWVVAKDKTRMPHASISGVGDGPEIDAFIGFLNLANNLSYTASWPTNVGPWISS